MYQYTPIDRRRRDETDFGSLAGSIFAADPRTNAQCRADEHRITRIVEPAQTDLVNIAPRHLADPSHPKHLHRAAYEAYVRIKAAAEAAGIPANLLTITSGYRSVAHQQRLWADALKNYGSPQAARRWVAPPGGSPHHTGRAIDLWLGTRNSSDNIAALRATLPYKWLVCNAGRFGFFPYASEPWHWEFNPEGFAPTRTRSATAPPSTPSPGPQASGGPEAQMIHDALRRGVRDVSRLTDLIFYARHPERRGQPVRREEQPLVREWLDIRDRIVRPGLGRSTTLQGFGQVVQPKAWLRMSSRVGLGQASAPLPSVANFAFRNAGTVDPENCCVNCTTLLPATAGRLNLGVGLRGHGAMPLRAANGMELAFTISGHRRGIEYDIVRTRRNSLWERRAGVWTRLESDPMGTNDDPHPDVDECLRLSHSNRIFAEDRPGWRNTVLPVPPGSTFGGFTAGVITHADATDVVLRFSFAEWVIARSRGEGIRWTRLELPPRTDGTPRRFIFWHSITWLVRDGSGQWVLDLPRNRIARGSLSAAIINSPPA